MLQHSFTLLGLLKSSSNLNIFFREFLYLCICHNNKYFLFDKMFFMCFWITAAEHGPLFKWKLTSCEKREMWAVTVIMWVQVCIIVRREVLLNMLAFLVGVEVPKSYQEKMGDTFNFIEFTKTCNLSNTPSCPYQYYNIKKCIYKCPINNSHTKRYVFETIILINDMSLSRFGGQIGSSYLFKLL